MSTSRTQPMPMWHSLMYSSGILMSLSSVPLLLIFTLGFWLRGDLPLRYALYASGVIFAIVAGLGASLWTGAILITKYQLSRGHLGH